MAVAKLGRTLAHYAWGGQGALSELFGWADSLEPEAEWWLGVHPARPSTLAADSTSLSEWLLRHEGRAELPYLFKVLAPSMPLSLQVHPSAAQAEVGFDDEVRRGVPADAGHRVFSDRHPKPELVVALAGGFSALAGVREHSATVEVLGRIQGGESCPAVESFVERLQRDGVPEATRWVLEGGPAVDDLLGELSDRAERDDTLQRVVRYFPGDPGIVVSLLLHRVDLRPGEALFVEAGVPHAYLSGFAVELMAPSDNVIRGGLTAKHVDPQRFVEIAHLEPGPIPQLAPVVSEGISRYHPDQEAFALYRVGGEHLSRAVTLDGPSIVLCSEGHWQLRGPRGSVAIGRGEAWAVSSSESPLTLEGSGEIWWASPA